MHIPDSQRFGVFLGSSLVKQCSGKVDTDHRGAESGDFARDAAMPACEVQNTAISRRSEQIEQRSEHRVTRIRKTGVIEVGNCVVSRATHIDTLSAAVGELSLARSSD